MIEVKDFSHYIGIPRLNLYEALGESMADLARIIQEIALCEADVIRGQVDAFQNSEQTSATGRNQEAEIITGSLRSTLVELYADKAVLLEEKQFLLRLLDA